MRARSPAPPRESSGCSSESGRGGARRAARRASARPRTPPRRCTATRGQACRRGGARRAEAARAAPLATPVTRGEEPAHVPARDQPASAMASSLSPPALARSRQLTSSREVPPTLEALARLGAGQLVDGQALAAGHVDRAHRTVGDAEAGSDARAPLLE